MMAHVNILNSLSERQFEESELVISSNSVELFISAFVLTLVTSIMGHFVGKEKNINVYMNPS